VFVRKEVTIMYACLLVCVQTSQYNSSVHRCLCVCVFMCCVCEYEDTVRSFYFFQIHFFYTCLVMREYMQL
jgi:hypothetical protein